MNSSESMKYHRYFLRMPFILIIGLVSFDRPSAERVMMVTEMGNIILQIEPEKAPIHSDLDFSKSFTL